MPVRVTVRSARVRNPPDRLICAGEPESSKKKSPTRNSAATASKATASKKNTKKNKTPPQSTESPPEDRCETRSNSRKKKAELKEADKSDASPPPPQKKSKKNNGGNLGEDKMQEFSADGANAQKTTGMEGGNTKKHKRKIVPVNFDVVSGEEENIQFQNAYYF